MASFSSEQIADLEKFFRINLINGITGYKQVNLLGTISNQGLTNLCVISSVFHLGANPLLLGMVMRPQRPNNDSLNNIRAVGEYTLNNVSAAWFKKAHQTSAGYPSGVSEFDECGFTSFYSEDIKAPFVAESAIKIGLKMEEIIDMPVNGTTIVIGKIIQIITDEGIVADDGAIDHEKALSMAVSGLDTYVKPVKIERLGYAKPGVER
jgi:flavin reductase (DIM6/NTAB) family NADH-FMN oxidoreductase RutF